MRTIKLFENARVIHNGYNSRYVVQYKNWFFWQHEGYYYYDPPGAEYKVHHRTREAAKEMAINRAQGLLDICEVWRG
jgi:hypothetical protein